MAGPAIRAAQDALGGRRRRAPLDHAGAVLQAKIRHAGEAAVPHVAGLGNPLRHGSIVGVYDKLDLNGGGSTLMVISEIVCALSAVSIPGLTGTLSVASMY